MHLQDLGYTKQPVHDLGELFSLSQTILEDEMEFNSRKVGDHLVIELIGSLRTEDDYKSFKQAIDLSLEATGKNIILDFEELNFINSSGLGKLLVTARRTTDLGGSLKLINLSDELKDLFNFTRLSERIKIFDSIKDAQEG